jgi:dTDP-4-dehydrorhamnose reductase
MRALVFGETGQVARELARAAARRRIEATCLGRARADLTDPAACARAIEAAPADVVVNAAAWTAVDAAEDDRATAELINAAAPGAMAAAAAAKGLPFLHLSTDYVFDGADPGRPWREDDPVAPLGAYGASKLAGERAVAAAAPDHVILRTAWVFSAHGRNFVKTMLAAGRGKRELRVVGDQQGSPTAAHDIADALWTIAEARLAGRGRPGVFHFAGTPATTWAELAAAVFARTDWPERPHVTAIATAEYPTRARRPAFSVLDCAAIVAAYGIAQPDWRPALDAVVSELAEVRA